MYKDWKLDYEPLNITGNCGVNVRCIPNWPRLCVFYSATVLFHIYAVFKYIQTNKYPLSVTEFLCLEIGSPGLPGAPPCLCSCTLAQHLFHVGMSPCLKEERTMALPTMPHLQAPTQGRRNNQPIRHCQPPSPCGQSSIVVQEEDRGNNNQSPWLSDFASCLLLLFSIQSGLNTSTSSLRTPIRELLERQGDHRDRSGTVKMRQNGGE